MRHSTLVLAASAVVVLGCSGVGDAAAAPPKCSDLSGVVDAGQICQIQSSDPGYSLTISYPVAYPDQQPVFDYVKQTRDGFLNVAQTPDGRAMPYELETTETEYGSDVPPRGTQSVVFQTYQGVGGAHPTTFYKSFNWDQGLRKPITIDTLFREGTAPFPVLLPLVQAEVDKQLGQSVPISPEEWAGPDEVRELRHHQRHAYLFFSQGDLLPGAVGAMQVTVPRASVDAMTA